MKFSLSPYWGSWELDVHAASFTGSDGFFHIYDCTPSSVAVPFGKVMDAIPAAEREHINRILKSALATQEPFDVEHHVVGRDAQYVWSAVMARL